jgi:hypothetical protein
MKCYKDENTRLALIIMRSAYIEQHNALVKSESWGTEWLIDISDLSFGEHSNALMLQWLEQNPMPRYTNLQDHQHAIDKAYWVLCKDEAETVFSGNEYHLNVPLQYGHIRQAILNRSPDKSMLESALSYVQSICKGA